MKSPLDAALSDQPASEAVAGAIAETPAAEPAAAPQPEAAPQGEGPARGADGKFTAKAPVADAPPVAEPAAPVPAAEPGHVPLSAVLDEREKRQAAERSLKALQENLERQRAEWRDANPPSESQRIEAQRYADNLRFSRRFAEREYGKELIQTVHDWVVARCDADPRFNEEMRASDDPYEAAVQAYNREQILSAVSPGDLEAFNAWKAAQGQLQAQSPQPIPQPPASAPPRSLATAPGNGALGGSAVNVGEGEAFRAAIG